MASSRAPTPPAPPHLRLHLHAASLLSPRLPLPLPHTRCQRGSGGRSRRGRLLSALPSPPSPSSPASRSQGVVSTAPIDREPPGPAPTPAPPPPAQHQHPHPQRDDPAIAAELARLCAARERLRGARTVRDKLRALDAEPRVAAFFGGDDDSSRGRGVLGKLEPREVLLLKCLVAAGQEHALGYELDWYSGDDGHQERRHHHRSSSGGSGGGRSALREALYSLAAAATCASRSPWRSPRTPACSRRRRRRTSWAYSRHPTWRPPTASSPTSPTLTASCQRCYFPPRTWRWSTASRSPPTTTTTSTATRCSWPPSPRTSAARTRRAWWPSRGCHRSRSATSRHSSWTPPPAASMPGQRGLDAGAARDRRPGEAGGSREHARAGSHRAAGHAAAVPGGRRSLSISSQCGVSLSSSPPASAEPATPPAFSNLPALNQFVVCA